MTIRLLPGQKPREPRVKVLIPSRMRAGGQWGDVCIHNISSRGLMARARNAPAPGAYVDIRRGTQTIIGRVAWRNGELFGVRTQDRLDVKAIIDEPRLATRLSPPGTPERPLGERRSAERERTPADIADAAERSRHRSALLQFALLAAAACGGSALVAAGAHGVIAAPMAAAARGLG